MKKISFSALKSSYRHSIDWILQGKRQYFSCYLPRHISFIITGFLKLFYSGIKLQEDQVKSLRQFPEDAVIVYVHKTKSYFEWLFYYTRFQQLNLKVPEIGCDYRIFFWQPLIRLVRIIIFHLDYFFRHFALPSPYASGFIQEELAAGTSVLISLVEDNGFYQRFVKSRTDPVRYLVEIQQTMGKPIVIVPLVMFFSKFPDRPTSSILDMIFGTEINPGRIRRLVTLFKNPGKLFVEVSEPLNLQWFLNQSDHLGKPVDSLSLLLRKQLLFQINRHRVSTIGPVLKSPEEFKESVLTHDRLRNFMEHHAQVKNIPLHKIRKQANEHLDEMAARYNPAIISIAAKIVDWIARVMFDGMILDTEGLNRIKTASQKGPLVFIPCHKSHLDYLILSYLMHLNNMPCPMVAAGKNLSFWPMGPMFRGCGAFFIRRSFKGAVLYSKVFSEYILKLLEDGFNIEFFIEGGRSRTGKLILPKLGLLSILLDSFKQGACKDLIFVPIYVGYDRVLEEGAYLHELEGGQKKPESFMQVIKARKLLKKRYGKIYINFHEPISLNALQAQSGLSIRDMTSKQNNELCRNLGFRIINAIDSVSVVTPHALAAGALLNLSQKRFSFEDLTNDIEVYMSYLYASGAKLADTLMMDPGSAIQQVLDAYANRKFVERFSGENSESFSKTEYKVALSKRPILEYYKNNCIIFFVPAVFTALTILDRDVFQFSFSDIQPGYAFLRNFFKNEFAYDVDKTPDYYVRKSLKAFIDDAIIIPHPMLPETYNITSVGFRKLRLFARFIKTYFESYWVVLNFFMRYPKNTVDADARAKKILSRGNRMYKRREIAHKEALSKINYKNAEDFFITHGVTGSEDKEQIEFYANAIQKYLRLLSS
jgi:glycerol-3-phosphate O-acyltransferase